ncbi:receptor-like protein 4 [Hibiscus syriacus]|nr:receptor-like protein 4 [Hibiscus syriacus]
MPPFSSFSCSSPLFSSSSSSLSTLTSFHRLLQHLLVSRRFLLRRLYAVVSEPFISISSTRRPSVTSPLLWQKNCYNVPLPPGRYYIRTFTVYDNYDGKSHPPSFDASVEGTLVFSWRPPWSESLARDGAYSDLFAFVKDGQLDFCFYSIATDPPIISSLKVLQIDPLSYDSARTGDNYILVNYGRLSRFITMGSRFHVRPDAFGRSWQSDSDYRAADIKSSRIITTKEKINWYRASAELLPDEIVPIGGDIDGGLEYELALDAKLDYFVWFHFAEIDSSVKKAGRECSMCWSTTRT